MENFDLILVLKHFIIGIVQGLTEPIPVSSSGHVMIVSEILGLGEQGFTFAIDEYCITDCDYVYLP